MTQLSRRLAAFLSSAACSLRCNRAVASAVARGDDGALGRARRLFATQQAGPAEEDEAHVPHGPKDTLLILGCGATATRLRCVQVRRQGKRDGNACTDAEGGVEAEDDDAAVLLRGHGAELHRWGGRARLALVADLAMAQHQSVEFINEAKENYLKALDIWRAIRGPESREVANMLCLIGVVLRDIGDLDAAKSALEDSLKIDKKNATVESQLSSVFSLNNLAGIEHLRGNMAEAIELYEDAARIMLTATGGDPNHRMIALLYYNLVVLDEVSRTEAGAVDELRGVEVDGARLLAVARFGNAGNSGRHVALVAHHAAALAGVNHEDLLVFRAHGRQRRHLGAVQAHQLAAGYGGLLLVAAVVEADEHHAILALQVLADTETVRAA
ncbi:tetratricopeptide repeat family protein, putative [Babesia caballi]|uniref:Tetratricopeptide repeat family protein, putative n=1 Tax=Babesia caballi TaxID=5871 RepID=A0AAV4LT69_BABCB|nr:tetratricopeptide repeat family protein, putative [Babesia caballi]